MLLGNSISSAEFFPHGDLRRRGWTAFVSHRALGRRGSCVVWLHPLAFGESLPQPRQKRPCFVRVVGSTEQGNDSFSRLFGVVERNASGFVQS